MGTDGRGRGEKWRRERVKGIPFRGITAPSGMKTAAKYILVHLPSQLPWRIFVFDRLENKSSLCILFNAKISTKISNLK